MLLFAQTQLLSKHLQNGGGVTHMAGGSVTYLDDIFTFCLKREVFVEGGDGIGFRFCDTNLFGYIAE